MQGEWQPRSSLTFSRTICELKKRSAALVRLPSVTHQPAGARRIESDVRLASDAIERALSVNAFSLPLFAHARDKRQDNIFRVKTNQVGKKSENN